MGPMNKGSIVVAVSQRPLA